MADLDVAMITIVAPAHLEAFESVEGIAHEKASIIEGLQPGGVAILQGDVVTSPILCAKAKAAQVRSLTFGAAEGADYRMVSVQIGDDSTVVRATPAGLKLVRTLSLTIEAHYAWMESQLGKARLAQLYTLLDSVIALEVPDADAVEGGAEQDAA